MRWLLSIVFLISITSSAQHLARTYGGANNDNGYSLIKLGDGGYALTGITWSYGASNTNAYLLRTNAMGDTLWTRVLGTGAQYGYKLELSADSYLYAGGWQSVVGPNQATVQKIDINGNIKWGRGYGISSTAGVDMRDFVLTPDKGYIGVGINTFSVSPLVDYFVFKADSQGNLQWGKHFGNAKWDYGMAVAVANNGYVVGGYTDSYNGNSSNSYDAMLMKLNSLGDTLWVKTYGDSLSSTRVTSMAHLQDGGYALFGLTNGGSGDDLFVIRTDSTGNVVWMKKYGSSGPEAIGNLIEMPDGGFLLMGNTGAVSGGGNWDIIFVRTNINGDTLWTRTFGTNMNEYSKQVLATDSGFTIVGTTGAFGSMDVLLFSTDSSGNTDCYSHGSNILVTNLTFTTSIVHPSVFTNVGYMSYTTAVTYGANVQDLCNTTSIIKNNENKVHVTAYPNPANDFISIECPAEEKNTVALISSSGSVVKELRMSGKKTNLSVNDLASGIYFLRIRNAAGEENVKIVITR